MFDSYLWDIGFENVRLMKGSKVRFLKFLFFTSLAVCTASSWMHGPPYHSQSWLSLSKNVLPVAIFGMEGGAVGRAGHRASYVYIL